MKCIIFNLKREWYDKIASGEKTIEYRSLVDKNGNQSKWCNIFGMDPDRFCRTPSEFDENEIVKPVAIAPNDWLAVFRVGYPSNSKPRKWPDIVRRIVKIDIGPCPYDGWDGEYFRIHFEPNVVRPSGLDGAEQDRGGRK